MQLEDQVQIAFIKWLNINHPKVECFHIPNGKRRSTLDALQLKRMGVKRGVADLFFPGLKLWIELKSSKKGKLSKSQQDFLQHRMNEEYSVIIGHGLEDVIFKFEKFLNGNDNERQRSESEQPERVL